MNAHNEKTFDQGLAAFEHELDPSNTERGSRNEATTRLHLIDTLFLDCLAWTKGDLTLEEHTEGTYADYILGSPGPFYLVEAKKEGIYFELPLQGLPRFVDIPTLLTAEPRLQSALQQAEHCAQVRGIGLCSLANGHQLVTFLASRYDGTPPLEGKALIFTSLADMRDNFRELWDTMSKYAIQSLRLMPKLQAGATTFIPAKLSESIPNHPGYQERNELQADLNILGDIFIESVADTVEQEREFLEACYCPSGALSQYAYLSRQILQSPYSAAKTAQIGVESKPARTKGGLSPDIVAGALSKKPIILLGDVGVGKSIFLRNLVTVEARQELASAIVLTVDFGSEPALETNLEEFVARSVQEQLFHEYNIDIYENGFVRGVYHGALERLKKGIHGYLLESNPEAFREKEVEQLEEWVTDQGAHLKSCLQHIDRGQNRQIVLCLDNVDQRPFEFQEQAFLIANSIAAHWPATVFLALRPDTFYKSKSLGSLTAYQPRVFTIAPPRIDAVVKRRLEFGRQQVGKAGSWGFGAGLEVDSRRLELYLDALIQSFGDNEELNALIDNLSGGNVRRALSFVSTFVGSGHVNTSKILRSMETNGRYLVAHHEFLRAITFGENRYYDPHRSPVVNVFDAPTGSVEGHFLLPLMVAIIHRDEGDEEGFVPVDDVATRLRAMRYEASSINSQMGVALENGLLEGDRPYSEEFPWKIRPTSIGTYTTRELVRKFAYVDAVIVDTPIFYKEYRDAIGDAGTIEHRLQRAKTFASYLDEAWNSLRLSEPPWSWEAIGSDLREDIARAERGAVRNKGSGSSS